MSTDNTLNDSQRGSEPPVTEQPENPTKESIPRPSTPDPLPRDRKLYAGRPTHPNSELTKAKSKWLELPESERNSWREYLFSGAGRPEICKRILDEFHISLHKHHQLERFLNWLKEDNRSRRRIESQGDLPTVSGAKVLPLPRGEGWGEGEPRSMTDPRAVPCTTATQPPRRKLRAAPIGRPPSELTKAKEHWLALPEPEREAWISFAFSAATDSEMCQWILNKSGIDLRKNRQTQRLRTYLRDQQLAIQQARENKEREEQIQKQHREWPLDRVREEVLKEAYASTRAKEDYKLGLQTVSVHCRVESNELDQRRYEDSKRAVETKAMQFCLDETRDYPDVQELFKQAFAALEKATAPK